MKSGIKKQKKDVFSSLEITLITILGITAAGILGFSGTIIWLVGSL